MKASTYDRYGPPDVLRLREIEIPVPKDNEVLVQVFATTVNRTDCAMLRAKPFIMRFMTGLFNPTRTILGTDFAGNVTAIGNEVTAFKVGDKIFGFEDTGLSTHAQYVCIPESNAISAMPQGVEYDQAVATLEGAHYAYNMLNKIELKPGDNVVVNGASGAIGSAAVQLLNYYGAHVTAVCNTKNIQLIQSLGAHKVIDYLTEDFTLSKEKYRYVFDAVGKSTFAKCKPLLEPDGAYIFSEPGPWAQNIFLALSTSMRKGKKVIFPIPVDCKRSVLLIRKLMEEGKFKAVIDRRYPFDKMADAFRYVETGEKTGSVVILMA
ncbi:MAG TPA: NAD(P)-dependent alcohol dehydrogenase [Chryseolinea sp.]|nr:NAD(P)-dependent alcohol dehydrogenase [Chryseolinea sp.]